VFHTSFIFSVIHFYSLKIGAGQQGRVKVSETPGAGNPHFWHLKMMPNIMKDVNMKK